MPLTVVTGANGFLGSEIVQQARACGIRIRSSDKDPQCRAHGIEFVQADVLDPLGLARALGGAEVLIHAAGLAHVFQSEKVCASAFHSINQVGTENAVRMAAKAGVRRVVLVSSVSVYGGTAGAACAESTPCRPEGPYAESKWHAEECAKEIASSQHMELVILRLATLYGDGDPGNVARLMRAIDRGRFVWVGDGSNRKSLLHRDDAARACVVAATASSLAGTSIFNVVGAWHTMREVVGTLAAALGRSVLPVSVPAPLAMAIARAGDRIVAPWSRGVGLAGGLRKWLAEDIYDGRLFEESFNFVPRIGLAIGLEREVAWYRQACRQGS
jgi:nucleoside-diphosphate-sugar epimerase